MTIEKTGIEERIATTGKRYTCADKEVSAERAHRAALEGTQRRSHEQSIFEEHWSPIGPRLGRAPRVVA